MPLLTAQQLHRVGIAVLLGAGVSQNKAEQVINLLVESNLTGHDSHGVRSIPTLVSGILDGTVRPGAEIGIVRETDTTAVVNGNWGLGQVVARETMNIAIKKAETHNIGVVTVFNCGHIGRMADYALMATDHDMIGHCAVNHNPGVVPFGGMQRMFNQSPIGWAIPAGKEPPFVLDISTSVSAGGKMAIARAKREKVPPGYIVDKDGKPSTDPEDFYQGGACLPMGGPVGYKGTGLAMVVDITAGLLSGRGAAYTERKAGQGVFQMALKIAAFRDLDEFKKEMDDLLQAVRNCKPAPGFREILVPGDLELRTKRIRLQKGVEIPQETWNEIDQAARKVKVDVRECLK